MKSTPESNFVVQQGLAAPTEESCHPRYSSLIFQPRVVGSLVVVGLITQWAPLFLGLGLVLLWSALLPGLNPFDALHNALLAGRPGTVRLEPAPPPRRFSQGMAAAFNLTIGVSLLMGWTTLAWVFQGLIVVALLALNFFKLCLGSYVYLVLTGQASLANRTMPWSRRT